MQKKLKDVSKSMNYDEKQKLQALKDFYQKQDKNVGRWYNKQEVKRRLSMDINMLNKMNKDEVKSKTKDENKQKNK